MIGPVDIVKSGQIGAIHYVVRCAVVAVGSHDNAVITGGAGLRDNIRADDIVVIGRVNKIHTGFNHGGELVGIILHVQRGRGFHRINGHAVFFTSCGEGVVQAFGISIRSAVDDTHMGMPRLTCIGCGNSTLETVGIAGAEDVIIFGGDGIGSGRRRQQAHTLFICGIRDSRGTAGSDGADNQTHALSNQRVERVQALGGVKLVIRIDDFYLTSVDAACLVDLTDRQVNRSGYSRAISSQRTGVWRNSANGDCAAAGRTRRSGRCGAGRRSGCSGGARTSRAAGSQAQRHRAGQQETCKSLLFHFQILLMICCYSSRFLQNRNGTQTIFSSTPRYVFTIIAKRRSSVNFGMLRRKAWNGMKFCNMCQSLISYKSPVPVSCFRLYSSFWISQNLCRAYLPMDIQGPTCSFTVFLLKNSILEHICA